MFVKVCSLNQSKEVYFFKHVMFIDLIDKVIKEWNNENNPLYLYTHA